MPGFPFARSGDAPALLSPERCAESDRLERSKGSGRDLQIDPLLRGACQRAPERARELVKFERPAPRARRGSERDPGPPLIELSPNEEPKALERSVARSAPLFSFSY